LPTYRAWRAIEASIARHEPDLVLIDPAWPLGLLGPFLSVPYGVIVHGAEATIPSRIPFVASSLRFVFRHAALAICAGSYPEEIVRNNAAEYTPPIVQIPPGVDTMRFTPVDARRRNEVRAALGIDEHDFVVSSYSRLVPRKGMDTLIRAAAQLQGELPRLRVVIGGSGRDEARLKKLALQLHAPVTFLGRVPDDELSDWIASSDLMVVDCRSRWLGLEQEGFGIVFVEAAATGVAQIAGRSGGSHEAVQNGVTGLVLADPRSDDLLARAIRALALDDERRLAYGRAARVAAVGRFEWYRLARQLSYELAPFDHFGADNSLS
jgi:phosphatidylinositol alpha-1,6-mannosyltransferase